MSREKPAPAPAPAPATTPAPAPAPDRKPDIPPKPICFLIDGKPVPASDALLTAVENLGRALLADARAKDPVEAAHVGKGRPTMWAWARITLGEVTRNPIAEVRFGSDADRPEDVLGDVLVVGA